MQTRCSNIIIEASVLKQEVPTTGFLSIVILGLPIIVSAACIIVRQSKKMIVYGNNFLKEFNFPT